MGTPFTENHWLDENGIPTGGCTFGDGFTISWQNGPLGRGEDRKAPNGAFVENIIRAAIGRIEFYESTRFSCEDNQVALEHLNLALESLRNRTREREDRNVEGTHEQ